MTTTTTTNTARKDAQFTATTNAGKVIRIFCKSVAILFSIAFQIIDPGHKLTSADFHRLVSCLWIVNHQARKLAGICSISTSVLDNAFCKARRCIEGCICQHCYAERQQEYQAGLAEHNLLNGYILRNVLIPVSAFKSLLFIFPYLRIESFGDVENVTQARNYLRIIKAFPRIRCAIWSKNIEIWRQAIAWEGMPKNATYIHSSSYINRAEDPDQKVYWFVDHVFTVYTKAFAAQNNITINCGGKKCLDCIRARKNCYYRNTERFINELKK